MTAAPAKPVAEISLAEYALQLAAELERADRQGLSLDRPEGTRFITLSDTLAVEIVATLRAKAGAESVTGWQKLIAHAPGESHDT